MEYLLQAEPDSVPIGVALSAALYRQDEYELAAEKLAQLQESLSDSSLGRLAKKLSPVVHAFRALAHARLGHDSVAREELATLRAAFDGTDPGEQGRALLREVEALIEPTPSSTGDG